jgi:endonuclease YncB( thermonuclease family)
MLVKRFQLVARLSAALLSWTAAASGQAPQKPFVVASNIQVESGDTWTQDGTKFRLYGVQSCLRGTDFAQGAQHDDCGLASIAQFAALVQTSAASCQPLGPANDGAVFVVCGAKVGDVTIDVGTALIASGYAFAAVDKAGATVNANYLVTELVAKNGRQGLWAGAFTHPVQMLLKGPAQ